MFSFRIRMVVVEELRQFVSTTSLKGVPRMYKSPTMVLRLTWAVAVSSFLVVAAYFSVNLIAEYVSHPTVLSVSERPIVEVIYEDNKRFPDVTVCNMNPFSSLANNVSDIITVRQYYHDVINRTTCGNCSEQEQDFLSNIRTELLTPEGYFQNIGSESAARIGHQAKNFIINCRIIYASGIKLHYVPCRERAIIKHFIHPRFYNCYTVQSPDDHSFSIGIYLELHLDNFNMEPWEYLKQSNQLTGHPSGVLADIHFYNTIPAFESITKTSAGMSSLVNVVFEKRQRAPAPYSDCKDYSDGERLLFGKLNESYRYDYSTPLCQTGCAEYTVTEHCGCRSINNLNGFAEFSFEAFPFCSSLEANNTVLFERMACEHVSSGYVMGECVHTVCPLMCYETSFTNTLSQSAWPVTPHSQAFYRETIQGRAYEGHYESLYNLTMMSSGDGDMAKLINAIESYRVVRNNFAHLEFVVRDDTYKLYEETPRWSFSSLLSQLGGALNLWSGITVMLLVEFLDLTLKICGFGEKKPDATVYKK